MIRTARLDPGRSQGATTPGAADDVRAAEDTLLREGLLDKRYARDGAFGIKTRTAYGCWQEHCGYRWDDADGIPGSTSLRNLVL